MDCHELLSFNKMMDKDSKERTKRCYQGLVKHFVEFIQTKKPNLVDGESVDLAEVTPEDVKMFFYHVSIKQVNLRQDSDRVFSNTVDTVNGKNVLNSVLYVTV
jgi:hypothetical protein